MQPQTAMSGRDKYDSIYRQNLEAEAEWLQRGAADKADTIGLLLSQEGIIPKRILELGCGTGEVIRECQRRGYAESYVGVDFSEDAICYLREHSEGIDAIAGDITSPTFEASGHFDVIILTHVIEHLENPADFLKALGRIDYSYLVAEVPLEDLPLCRLKSYVKDRRNNPAGHVQFFTGASFLSLLKDAGFQVIRQRRYAPKSPAERIRFMCKKNGWGTAKYVQALITGRYLPLLLGPLWSRLYYSHLAVLCRKP